MLHKPPKSNTRQTPEAAKSHHKPKAAKSHKPPKANTHQKPEAAEGQKPPKAAKSQTPPKAKSCQKPKANKSQQPPKAQSHQKPKLTESYQTTNGEKKNSKKGAKKYRFLGFALTERRRQVIFRRPAGVSCGRACTCTRLSCLILKYCCSSFKLLICADSWLDN